LQQASANISEDVKVKEILVFRVDVSAKLDQQTADADVSFYCSPDQRSILIPFASKNELESLTRRLQM
jgi:hypothetical protein